MYQRGFGVKKPDTPPDERERLGVLQGLDLLDTRPEDRFDRVTRLAKRLFDVPIVLISLVDADRQWFKSRQGLEVSQTSREVSFCGHAILDPAGLVISDAARDERFSQNPLVQGDPRIRFYAGVPIRVGAYAVGTLCLIDRRPRSFDARDVEALRDLAQIVEQELTARREASTDELTGLFNRRGFLQVTRHTIAQSRRRGEDVTLLAFDLDKFKEINDTFGHAGGDQALVAFAQGLRDSFREADVLARTGGDEFSIFALGPLSRMEAPLGRLSENLQDTGAGLPFSISFSCGGACLKAGTQGSIDELMAAADEDLYRAKRGRGPASDAPAPVVAGPLVGMDEGAR